MKRPPLRRLCVVLLNLITPGLGLLRTGLWKAALLAISVPLVVIFASIGLFAIIPAVPIAGFAAIAAFWALVILLAYLGSIMVTWQAAAYRVDPRPWWSRWYSIVGVWMCTIAVSAMIVPLGHSYYRPFFVPSKAMMPTLLLDDKFVGDMRARGAIKRGEVGLFDVAGAIYVKRVVALAGDQVEMQDGVPVINGVAADHRRSRKVKVDVADGRSVATLVSERLPGAATAHEIYDIGYSQGDDYPEVVVPSGHVFVLGDNRDNSADSRFSLEERGTGMVPLEKLVGRPLFIHWRKGEGLSGIPVR